MPIRIFSLHGVDETLHPGIPAVARELTDSEGIAEELSLSVVGSGTTDKWQVLLGHLGQKPIERFLYRSEKTSERLKVLLEVMLGELGEMNATPSSAVTRSRLASSRIS